MQPFLQWKNNNVAYSEGVFVALVIQHAMRMRHVVICVCSAARYFSSLSHKLHDFREKIIEHGTCVLIFLHLLSETFKKGDR